MEPVNIHKRITFRKGLIIWSSAVLKERATMAEELSIAIDYIPYLIRMQNQNMEPLVRNLEKIAKVSEQTSTSIHQMDVF